MHVLLHICCGPCALMPIRRLLDQGHDLTGYFFNPNPHPLTEYLRRREGALAVAARTGITLLFPDGPEYDAEAWCRAALTRPAGRCAHCREIRFSRSAALARTLGFEAFTSSLLYSRRQDHQGMIRAAENAAAASGVTFLYQDFRTDWQEGINRSKEWGIYRQQYCGCLFSEQERYQKDLARLLPKENEKG